MGRDAEQLPPLSSRKRDGPGQASGSYARTSPPSQNEGWGYEHDIETINRNASARRGTYRDNERLEPSYRNTSSDVWYTQPRGRGHEDNRAQVYQNDPWPHTGKAMDHYDGPYDDREASSGSPSDYDDRAHNRDRDRDWTPRREWFQNASESPDSSIKEQEPGLEDSGGATEDVWGVRETPQWPASEDQFREPEEDEIVLDELTRYWATPEHADVLRSNNKRSNKAFSENPVVTRRHKDSWGAAPQPAMTYHCEGYTSDVLIEQSKREFWSKRNGEWFLLNESTDTRFSRQQQQQQEQEELQQQLQERQRRWQGQPQGARSALYKRSHITSHDDDEFTPEPFDHARAGFVTYEEWRIPRVNKGDPSEDEGSTQYNTDYEERRTPVDIEITDSGMRAPIEDGFDIEEVPPKDELTEDEASTSVPQSPTGAFGTLVDLGVQESEPESESRTGTETPTLTVPKQGLTMDSKDRRNDAASCNVGLLVDLGSEEPLIPVDNTPSTVFGALSAAELFSMFSSPQEQEQGQGFSKGNQLEDHPRLKETQSEKRAYDNIFDLIPSNLVSAPPEAAMSPTPTETTVSTGSLGSSLFDFVDPHDWLSQLARKNMEQFQESQANHKKEWTELMEKQQQDSRKIQEFIERSNPPKPVPRAKKSRIPVSLSIVVETKDFGRQELRVREEDDLKVLVEDFCQTYNMHSYEMALWVTVASAIKKHKKMLRRDGQQSAVPTLI